MKNNNENEYFNFTLLKFKSIGLSYSSKLFMSSIKKNRETNFINFKKGDINTPDCSDFIFVININGNKSFLTKKIPVIVEYSANGCTDVISGCEYCTYDMAKYRNSPDFRYCLETLTPNYVASVIRNLSEDELEEYNEKSLALSNFIKEYTLKLDKIDQLEIGQRKQLLQKKVEDIEFIHSFQRTRRLNINNEIKKN